MAIISTRSGNRVGWATYDNEDEARERAQREKGHAQRMIREGYDFGYVNPGWVEQIRRDGELVQEWEVTTT